MSVGYELRRQLADALPDGLSSGERLVALELADQANDRTRLAFGHQLLALVARRCGFANEKQVGKVLGKLARRGIEFRVQVVRDGTPLIDKRGRPVFAFDGRETTYRIPAFGEPAAPPPEEKSPPEVPQAGDHPPDERPREVSQSGDLSLVVVSQPGEHFSTGDPGETPSGPPAGTAHETSGPPLGSEWSPAGVQVVPPAGDPSPHFPSPSPQVSRRTARELEAHRWLADNYGLTDAEATQVIEQVRARGPRKIENLVRYMAPMVIEGTLADIVATVQLQSSASAPAAALEDDRPDAETDDEPHLTVVSTSHSRSVREALTAANPDRPQQLPLMQAVPDPRPPAERDEDGIPAVTERENARAVFDRLNAERRAAAEATEARRRHGT